MTPRRKKAFVVVGIVAAVVLACLTVSFRYIPGSELRRQVLSEIKNAKSIKVVEHSDRFDRPEDVYRERIIRSVDLTPIQISGLRSVFPRIPFSDIITESMCVFSPHHRLELAKSDGSTFIIEICFQCGQISLGKGDIQQIPDVWNEPLRVFVTSLGLDVDVKKATQLPDATSPSVKPTAGAGVAPSVASDH